MKPLPIFRKNKNLTFMILTLFFLFFLVSFLLPKTGWAKGTQLNFGFVPASKAGTPALVDKGREGNFVFQLFFNLRSFLSQKLAFIFGRIK